MSSLSEVEKNEIKRAQCTLPFTLKLLKASIEEKEKELKVLKEQYIKLLEMQSKIDKLKE